MPREIYSFCSDVRGVGQNGYFDALSVFAGKSGFVVLRDRFGFLNQFSPYRLYQPYEAFPATNCAKSLAEIMDARAVELLGISRSENLPLYLMFSGGVDSTAMTCALLKASAGDYANLRVIYSQDSFEENSEFVYFLRNSGVDMQFYAHGSSLMDAQESALDSGYVVTGWCADQLFGSQINQQYPDWYFRDWRPWLGYADAIGQLEAAFDHYALPVKTFGEFVWFMNFTSKYDIVKYRYVASSGKLSKRCIAFYDAPLFQSWSVSNFDKLHRYSQADTQHYKEELKDYIFAYNGDAEYRHNKGKVVSWSLLSG